MPKSGDLGRLRRVREDEASAFLIYRLTRALDVVRGFVTGIVLSAGVCSAVAAPSYTTGLAVIGYVEYAVAVVGTVYVRFAYRRIRREKLAVTDRKLEAR